MLNCAEAFFPKLPLLFIRFPHFVTLIFFFFKFQVSAYNRAGWGEPSDSTDPKLLKASKAPPTIDRTGFPEGIVNVKVNSQLVLEVRFFSLFY